MLFLVSIIFGSVATGLATRKSDIDLIIISQNHLDIKKYDYLPYRFEIHQYTGEDIKDPVDFAVLDSLTNGIVFKGDIFNILAELNSFPKSYFIYRLEKAKEYLDKAQNLQGDSLKYYQNLAEITIGEIQSIIKTGLTIPKKEIEIENIHEIINELEIELASQGERIWLT